jgi:hypothetical protein
VFLGTTTKYLVNVALVYMNFFARSELTCTLTPLTSIKKLESVGCFSSVPTNMRVLLRWEILRSFALHVRGLFQYLDM